MSDQGKRRPEPPFPDAQINHLNCRTPRPASLPVRLLLVLAGTLALTLGVIGIFLPVLPTTPFLLLAASCYLRSSLRLYRWLLSHRLFGRTIRNYLLCKAVSKRTRTLALILLWVSLTVSFILVPVVVVRIVLPLVGIGVSIHLLSLRTLAGDDRRTPGRPGHPEPPDDQSS